MNSKIWLSSPHMGGNELSYINEAFDANWIAPLGPNVNNFEESIKTYLGNGVEVAALSSGTAALHLALILLGVSKDDEVICQSFTFAASANPIIYQGATPVFVDSEPDTWNIEITSKRVIAWSSNIDITLEDSDIKYKEKFFLSLIKQSNFLAKNLNSLMYGPSKIICCAGIILSGMIFKENYSNFKIGIKELEKIIL